MSEQAYRQRVFINQAAVAQWTLLTIAIAIGIVYLQAPMMTLAIQGIAFLLAAIINWWCLRHVRQNYQLRFARINLTSCLGLSIVSMVTTTERLVLAAAMVLIFLVLSSAYFESSQGTTAWGVLGIVAFLGSVAFRQIVSVPVLQLGILEDLLFFGMPSLIIVLSGQYSQQINEYLRNSLATSEAHRHELSIAYTAVEQQVQERTVELEAANRQLTSYAAAAEERAMLEERNRLAREIHDGLGHYLTKVNMQLNAATRILPVDQENGLHSLRQAQMLTQEALVDVRQSVEALRIGPTGYRPLVEAVQELVTESQAAGMQVTFEVLGESRPLDPQTELTLYRIVQEGLTNVHKHAQAEHVDIELSYSPTLIHVLLCDDGQGAANTTHGFGLLGMRERVHQLGGTIQVYTAPGEGFTLKIEVPA